MDQELRGRADGHEHNEGGNMEKAPFSHRILLTALYCKNCSLYLNKTVFLYTNRNALRF